MDNPILGLALTPLPAGIELYMLLCGCAYHDGCRVVACLAHPQADPLQSTNLPIED